MSSRPCPVVWRAPCHLTTIVAARFTTVSATDADLSSWMVPLRHIALSRAMNSLTILASVHEGIRVDSAIVLRSSCTIQTFSASAFATRRRDALVVDFAPLRIRARSFLCLTLAN